MILPLKITASRPKVASYKTNMLTGAEVNHGNLQRFPGIKFVQIKHLTLAGLDVPNPPACRMLTERCAQIFFVDIQRSGAFLHQSVLTGKAYRFEPKGTG